MVKKGCKILQNKFADFSTALKSDQIQIKEGMENIPPLDKMDKDVSHLVCFDDLVLAKNQSAIENYYIRARKLNCSVVYLSQSYFRIPKIIRNNCVIVSIPTKACLKESVSNAILQLRYRDVS
jgi:hypothetical protein